MDRKVVFAFGVWTVLVLAYLLIVALNVESVTSTPVTIRVREDFLTIQDAIDAASPGDTILVAAGTYHENVVVDKSNLTLVGESASTTVIDGGGDSVVSIHADGVNMTGFTVENGWVGVSIDSSNNSFSGNNVLNHRLYGIQLHGNNNSLCRNNITNNKYGMSLGGSSNLLRNNSMADNLYNLKVWGGMVSDFIQDVDTSNTVDGKPIYYWINHHNVTVPSDAGYVVLVNSTNITVEGSELDGILLAYASNSVVTNNIISSSDYGVYLFIASDTVVSGNHVTGNGLGVYLHGSKNNTVSGNNITNNGLGVKLASSSSSNTISGNNITNNNKWGTTLQYSSSNTISENNITNNGDHGIYFQGSSYNTILGNIMKNNGGSGINFTLHAPSFSRYSSHNTVSRNNITENELGGIRLSYHSSYNGFFENDINNNNRWAVYMVSSCDHNIIVGNNITGEHYGISLGYSDANEIYHNNFINNTWQAQVRYSGNLWDDGYPSGGNFWSDYAGQDLDGDGIGDTPYDVAAYAQDHYPLMDPWPLRMIHHLEVALKAPTRVLPGNSTLLEATVSNNGWRNETDVTLSLSINGNVANSTIISSLTVGSSYTINYPWIPTIDGVYNVTAYATPIQGEINIADNQDTTFVARGFPPVRNINTGLYYETIQEAIDASETSGGHTISVEAGTYYEHVAVYKSLALVGESPNITIIDGDGTGNVVTITASNVNVTGFTIQHSKGPSSQSGIYLSSVSNCNIIGNNITNATDYGNAIKLSWSSNNVIFANNVSDNGRNGIECYQSSSNNISRNNIRDNGGISIHFDWLSSNNTLLENNITNSEYGIMFSWSSYNVLRNNIMVGNRYNFGIQYGSALSHFIHDVDTSNTIDGKPIYYWVNSQNMEVPSDAGYVALVNSTGITIEGLELKNNMQGILIANTTISSLTDSSFTDNYYGVHLWSSNYNTIYGNDITNNWFPAVFLYDSSNNTVSANNIANNKADGIYLCEASYNIIFGNNLTNNNHYGVDLYYNPHHNNISGNNIANNNLGGVRLGLGSHNNIVLGNNITNNRYGIELTESSINKIYHNNFISNRAPVYDNSWDYARAFNQRLG